MALVDVVGVVLVGGAWVGESLFGIVPLEGIICSIL